MFFVKLTIRFLFLAITLRLLINSYLINKRDGSSFFIFFLFPLSQQKVDFMTESALKPWWKVKKDESKKNKILKMISNITTVLIVGVLIGVLIYKIFLANYS
ncbi:MAG: hypothetical protein H6566_21125 [Lewinellaceae bacterium]|nr:hypothetical protein [Lewinellaceae bacterium]